MKVLFGLTGSIACYKACTLISQLVKLGHEVQVVATHSALQFVGKATLEGLTRTTVLTDLYEPGRMMDHIHLARWADVFVICPATAHALNKLAVGLADDLLSSLALAYEYEKPFLIAPAMNSKMLSHPATQKSIALLKSWGVDVFTTGSGSLACGEVGDGRLLEPDEILQKIVGYDLQKTVEQKPVAQRTSPHILHGLNVLVTAGGTKEPIDQVRSITNTSTGKTGLTIAELLSTYGANVTFLSSGLPYPSSTTSQIQKYVRFETYGDLADELKSQLTSKKFDVVIHSAAVSDYSVASITNSLGQTTTEKIKKIDSDGSLQIQLSKNPKLIDQFKNWSLNKQVKVIGFKLTANASESQKIAAVTNLIRHSHCDYVVANDISEITSTFHPTQIFDRNGEMIAKPMTKTELAQVLAGLLAPLSVNGTKHEVIYDLSP